MVVLVLFKKKIQCHNSLKTYSKEKDFLDFSKCLISAKFFWTIYGRCEHNLLIYLRYKEMIFITSLKSDAFFFT